MLRGAEVTAWAEELPDKGLVKETEEELVARPCTDADISLERETDDVDELIAETDPEILFCKNNEPEATEIAEEVPCRGFPTLAEEVLEATEGLEPEIYFPTPNVAEAVVATAETPALRACKDIRLPETELKASVVPERVLIKPKADVVVATPAEDPDRGLVNPKEEELLATPLTVADISLDKTREPVEVETPDTADVISLDTTTEPEEEVIEEVLEETNFDNDSVLEETETPALVPDRGLVRVREELELETAEVLLERGLVTAKVAELEDVQKTEASKSSVSPLTTTGIEVSESAFEDKGLNPSIGNYGIS